MGSDSLSSAIKKEDFALVNVEAVRLWVWQLYWE